MEHGNIIDGACGVGTGSVISGIPVVPNFFLSFSNKFNVSCMQGNEDASKL